MFSWPPRMEVGRTNPDPHTGPSGNWRYWSQDWLGFGQISSLILPSEQKLVNNDRKAKPSLPIQNLPTMILPVNVKTQENVENGIYALRWAGFNLKSQWWAG